MGDIELLQARVQELETQCAALRDALDTIGDFVSRLPMGSPRQEKRIKHELEKADKALASDAGRELVERLRQLEAIAEAATAMFGNIFGNVSLEALQQFYKELEDGEQNA